MQAHETELGINRTPAPLDPGAPSEPGQGSALEGCSATTAAFMQAVRHVGEVQAAAQSQEILRLRAVLKVRACIAMLHLGTLSRQTCS